MPDPGVGVLGRHAGDVRDRHGRERRPGLPDRPGRVRGLRASRLLRQLPGLHDGRHPGRRRVPRLRAAPAVRRRAAAARSRSSASARAGCCRASPSPTGPTCARRSPTWSPPPAPSTARTSAAAARRRRRARRPAGSRRKGSDLLRAINAQPDETPGDVSYTTVRSATDETVQPQTGKHPTSALKGATNVLIQDVCPGRDHEAHRHGDGLGDLRAVRGRGRHDGKGRKGAGSVKRLPAERLRPPLRGRPRRGEDDRLPRRRRRPDRRATARPRRRSRASRRSAACSAGGRADAPAPAGHLPQRPQRDPRRRRPARRAARPRATSTSTTARRCARSRPACARTASCSTRSWPPTTSSPDRLKSTAAWVGERVGRLKPNDRSPATRRCRASSSSTA